MKKIIKINFKSIKVPTFSIVLVLGLLLSSCTDDFEQINVNPNLPAEATSASLLGAVEYFTFAEPRFVTWRGNLLTTSQFSHQFSTKVAGSWWSGSDNYTPDPAWGNVTFDKSFTRSGLIMRNLLIQYGNENDANGQAMMKIIMSLFHQRATDNFGSIPYSEVILPQLEVDPPKYDTQKDIYKAILEDLKSQMDALGSSTTTIGGAAGDFIYEGDPQKWKVLANTLRLRMALRSRDAFNADGESAFIDGVIADCLSNTLIDGTNEATLTRSEGALTNANLDGGFEDVFWGFGAGAGGTGVTGSKWILTEKLVAFMRDNNDPRLTQIATEAENGGYSGGFINSRTAAVWEDVSKPSERIVGTAFDEISGMAPVMVLTAAESYFLQAEAALLGYGGDANSLYQSGILASISFWGADAGTFIADEAIATLSGTTEDQLNQVWNQRWLASLTNGYESWALVRRADLIPQITDNVNFWVTEPNNGNVPKRFPYSPTEKTSNTVNVDAAIAEQGPDLMTTALWWDVN
ncbi:SusD/RagB family nutrient-binding outer membrane lipoprotein [Flavivirga spongiicola]|uniref:SusD/RagB family nutrient-binding outer membrane lipoprotein n=1 Tax=Flavivirga spongiicola TaxID=421621 RepID=A0ABU7XT37_9FLAO|nr:SusD/RagB family nutrient-binding outer membrane lipoprotein [Flavivirga sp. MEBiC05379]MDO5978104.1 SusD/RagB family nutrient-binding outer membrane lipoprotein [Flavivirga sp. MEBiC05379]